MKTKANTISHYYILAAVGSLCVANLSYAQMGIRGASTPEAAPPAASENDTTEANQTATSTGSNKNGGGLSAADKKFIMNAAKGGMMEVNGGKMAAEKAQKAEVKKFGNRMVADHSKANDELKAIASKKGVNVPSETESMTWKSDKKYMDMMVKDHEKDLSEFQQEAQNGSDPQLKRFAEKTSKIIEKHLSMAKEIDGSLK